MLFPSSSGVFFPRKVSKKGPFVSVFSLVCSPLSVESTSTTMGTAAVEMGGISKTSDLKGVDAATVATSQQRKLLT